jgi:hypothetical protein
MPTEVVLAGQAKLTLTACSAGVDGDVVPNCDGSDVGADRDDGPGGLVTRDQREDRALELAVENVSVGAADAHCGYLDHNLLRTWYRVGNLTKCQLAGGFEHNCSHLLDAPIWDKPGDSTHGSRPQTEVLGAFEAIEHVTNM